MANIRVFDFAFPDEGIVCLHNLFLDIQKLVFALLNV